MKNKAIVGLVALVVAALATPSTLARQSGQGGSPHPNQECNTTSAGSYSISVSVTKSSTSMAGLCSSTRVSVASAMLGATGVECGPCEEGDCGRMLSNLSTGIDTGAPSFDPGTGLWSCTSSFDGTHRVRCLPC